MSSYTELHSEYDQMPEFTEKILMRHKIDVKNMLDYHLNAIDFTRKDDRFHSAKYYVVLEDLIKAFMRKVYLTVLPQNLEPWWRYSYEISHKGICLYLEHIGTIWINDENGETDEETVDQVFPLVRVDAKMLTVDEYAKLYGVEQVTVRQWIRRGKLREAEKAGKEWRISELTDVPGRYTAFTDTTYKWIAELKNLPEGFDFLNKYDSVEIRKREINTVGGGKDYYLILSSRARKKDDSVAMEISEKQREDLEYYLISNPDVLYTGNTKVYNYLCDDLTEDGEED